MLDRLFESLSSSRAPVNRGSEQTRKIIRELLADPKTPMPWLTYNTGTRPERTRINLLGGIVLGWVIVIGSIYTIASGIINSDGPLALSGALLLPVGLGLGFLLPKWLRWDYERWLRERKPVGYERYDGWSAEELSRRWKELDQGGGFEAKR